MSDPREKRAFVSGSFPFFRWWSGDFRRSVYPGNGTASASENSHRLLFFCVSSVLHAAAIFSLAATPGPKKATSIEVSLLGPPPSIEFGQISSPQPQKKNAHPSERKSPGRMRKERPEARTTEAVSAAQATEQSLAQSLRPESTTSPAVGGGGTSEESPSQNNDPAAGGNQPGEAGTPNSGTEDHALSQYLRLVRERIGRYKKYPLVARKRGLEGQVGIRFLLTGAGEAQLLAISRSSGREILDRAALKAVEDGAPFPRPPSGLFVEPITIELNIVFNLS